MLWFVADAVCPPREIVVPLAFSLLFALGLEKPRKT